MKKYFFFALTSFVLLSSCSKQTETPDKISGSLTDFDFSFQQTDLDYVKIPEGTYFLYRDSASNSLDSVIVTKSHLEYKIQEAFTARCLLCIPKNYPASSYLNFNLQLDKIDSTNKVEWFYSKATMYNPKAPQVWTNTIWGIQPLILTENTFSSTFKIWDAIAYNTSSASNKISKLTIEGIEYTDVIMLSDKNTTDTLSPYYQGTTYYWAKGVGIIKRSLTKGSTTQTWTLVKKGK